MSDVRRLFDGLALQFRGKSRMEPEGVEDLTRGADEVVRGQARIAWARTVIGGDHIMDRLKSWGQLYEYSDPSFRQVLP